MSHPSRLSLFGLQKEEVACDRLDFLKASPLKKLSGHCHRIGTFSQHVTNANAGKQDKHDTACPEALVFCPVPPQTYPFWLDLGLGFPKSLE